MKTLWFRSMLFVTLIISCCLALAGCGDKIQNPPITRIVGDLNQSATLLEIVLPADCDDVAGANSSLNGRVNNVDLDQVKVVMYTSGGVHYGTLRIFADNGTFSMVLPCDRRVRLILAHYAWDPEGSLYPTGPPAVSDTILATFWDIDRVLGGISGLVRNAFDNSLVQDVEVSWVIDDSPDQDTTGIDGFFVVGSKIPSGTYEFLFSKAGFAQMTQSGVIPPLAEIQGPNNPYPGDITYVENLEIRMPPLTASLSGHIRLIDPVLTDTIAAANIEVQLLLNDNITSNVLKDTTDAEGFYSFEQVPAADILSLVVPSFVFEAYTYGPIDSTLELLPGSTVIDALLSAGGGGSYRLISEPDRR